MSNKITLYNSENLKLIAEVYPEKWEKIKYKNKEKWLTKEDYPTYKQLTELSLELDIPFGYFFGDIKFLRKFIYKEKQREKNISYLYENGFDTLLCILDGLEHIEYYYYAFYLINSEKELIEISDFLYEIDKKVDKRIKLITNEELAEIVNKFNIFYNKIIIKKFYLL